MLDNLLQLAKSELSKQLQDEAGLSGSQVNQTVDVAKDSFVKQMASEAMSGNLTELLDIFNGKSTPTTANPLVMRLVNQFGGDLMEKIGVSKETAAMVSNMVIPFVMQQLGSKETGEADDESSLMDKLGLDVGGIAGSLLGGLFK